MGKEKKTSPLSRWKSLATPLAMRSRVSASLQSPAGTASPPLSALAASLGYRHVGSGGMSDSRLTRGMKGFTKALRARRMPVHTSGGEAAQWQEMLLNASQASIERPQGTQKEAAARDVPVYHTKRCTGFQGDLNTIPDNSRRTEFMWSFLWYLIAWRHRKGPHVSARPFSRVRSSAPQPVPPFMPTLCVPCTQA